jgi:hypothetical protein
MFYHGDGAAQMSHVTHANIIESEKGSATAEGLLFTGSALAHVGGRTTERSKEGREPEGGYVSQTTGRNILNRDQHFGSLTMAN